LLNECNKLRASLFHEAADFLDFSHDFVDLPFGPRRRQLLDPSAAASL
jgi:hypothetical protein